MWAQHNSTLIPGILSNWRFEFDEYGAKEGADFLLHRVHICHRNHHHKLYLINQNSWLITRWSMVKQTFLVTHKYFPSSSLEQARLLFLFLPWGKIYAGNRARHGIISWNLKPWSATVSLVWQYFQIIVFLVGNCHFLQRASWCVFDRWIVGMWAQINVFFKMRLLHFSP